MNHETFHSLELCKFPSFTPQVYNLNFTIHIEGSSILELCESLHLCFFKV
jgi:hypothetical protein